MARPCKAVSTMSKHLTNEEIEKRKESEDKLKGDCNNLDPPEYLNKNQKKLFLYIKGELAASDILGNLDVYILTKCAIAIDRLQYIENIINKKPSALLNKDLMSSKDKYDKDFYRCCNELSLSPQSRAKISNINKDNKEKEEDPVAKALRGEG